MGSMNGFQKPSLMQKREYDRVSFLKRITLKDVKTNHLIEANGIDINIKGVRFYSEKFFSMNDRISMQIWLDNVSVWISGKIIWSHIEQDGAITGVQFDDPIKPDTHPKLYKMIYTNEDRYGR